MRRGLTTIAVVLVGFSVLGCREDKPQARTLDVSGTIENIDLAKRTVLVSAFIEKLGREEQFTVLVTDETELMIDGSLAKMEDVRIGELAEGTIKVLKEDGARRYVALQVRVNRGEVIKAPPVPTESPLPAPSNPSTNGAASSNGGTNGS